MQKTIISWTKHTWNPVHGCHKVSEGCRHCYAETLSLRYGHTKFPWTAQHAAQNVQLKPHKLREPYRVKEPSPDLMERVFNHADIARVMRAPIVAVRFQIAYVGDVGHHTSVTPPSGVRRPTTAGLIIGSPTARSQKRRALPGVLPS